MVNQKSEVRSQKKAGLLLFLICAFCLLVSNLDAQTPGPIFRTNAEGVQGVGRGDWPYGADLNIYVSPTGNDTTGNGSSGSPYLTVGRALKDVPMFVSKHYVINLAAGTYREEVDIGGHYFGTTNIGNFNKGTIELKGDPAAPDSYVISGANAGAPTTPVRNYAVFCSFANCILNGVSLQYAALNGFLQAGGVSVINASTFRHFTTPSGTYKVSGIEVRVNGTCELRGNSTISDAMNGLRIENFSEVFGYFTGYDYLNTGFPVNTTFTVTGITSGVGINVADFAFYDASGTTSVTGTNVAGSIGVHLGEFADFDTEIGTVSSFDIGALVEYFSRLEINNPTFSNLTTGFKVRVSSQVDFFAVDPTFTTVTTQYALSQNAFVTTPTQTLFDGTVKGTGAVSISAGGTNQNITLTPSGTGSFIVPGASGDDKLLIQLGPSPSAFGADAQGYVNAAATYAAALNAPSVRKHAFLGVNENNSTTNQNGVYGLSVATHTSGTKLSVNGTGGDAYSKGAGNTTFLTGVRGFAEQDGAGAVTTMASLYAQRNFKSAGTVTTNYGVYVEDQSGLGTSNYGIFTVGSAPSQFGGAVISGLNTVAFSATPTFDASRGNTQKITLTANVTSSTLTNASAGEQINFIICQDATGGRTFVWPTNVLGVMTIGATASKCSAQSFIYDGTNAYATTAGVANI